MVLALLLLTLPLLDVRSKGRVPRSIQHPRGQETREVSRGCWTVSAEAGGKDRRGVLIDSSEPGGLGALSMWGLYGALQGCGGEEGLR